MTTTLADRIAFDRGHGGDPVTLEQAFQLLRNKRAEYAKAGLSGSILLQLHLERGVDKKVNVVDSQVWKVGEEGT